MRISEELFDNKMMVLSTINNLYARHGNGIDMQVEAFSLIVCVRLIVSDKYSKPVVSVKFDISMQSGGTSACRQVTEDKMYKALRKCGVEFVSMGEQKGKCE